MRKNHSNWREDLREVVDIESSEPETEAKSEVRVGDKKVDNKITINPVMKEAFGEIGALVIEVTEIGEEHCGDKEKKKRDIENLQNDKDTKEGRKPGKLKENLGMLQQRRAKTEVQTAKIDMKIAKERTKTELNAEETEDGLKDRRTERGGVDGNNRYNKPVSNTPNTFGKKKPVVGGPSAMDVVKSQIRAKYGKGAIIDTKKK